MTIPVCIPEELIIQVLKEVCVKSLLRFRCVSKRWLSIIDDPFFVSLHRERSHSRAGGVIFLIKRDYRWRPYLYNPVSCLLSPPAEYLIRDGWMCAEGLLLCSDQIWNLSTGKRIYYPRLPAGTGSRRYFLGFDPLSKEYKLVSVSVVQRSILVNRVYRREVKRVAEILTLGTNSWRSVVDVNDVIHGDHRIWGSKPMTSCCIDGTLYIYLESIKTDAAGSLITFDLHCEKFRLVPFPQEAAPECQIGYDLRGNLFLLEYFQTWTWGWKLEDVRSGTWKPQGTTKYSNFSKRFCPDLLNAASVPQLNQVLEGGPYESCQTVETLFQTNNFKPDPHYDDVLDFPCLCLPLRG